jgi:sugar phosphate isomerase/epimerase
LSAKSSGAASTPDSGLLAAALGENLARRGQHELLGVVREIRRPQGLPVQSLLTSAANQDGGGSMNDILSRRQWLGGISATVATGLATASVATGQQAKPAADPFIYCLNTATIRGQGLSLMEEVGLAAKMGYQAIEPWINELERHVEKGGNLRDLAARISDNGLRVPSAIGFAEWIVDDEGQRKKGLERARRDMDLVRQIGGSYIAAPPSGATKVEVNLQRAAERYRALCEIGAKIGVIPQLELWGFSRTLGRLGETAQVAIESGHRRACILADVYHLYKGGSGFDGVRLLNCATMQAFHLNDYPAKPPRSEITDAHRVYPGDGIAPLVRLLRDLRECGFRGALSLEVFNRDYWKQDVVTVLRTGLDRMRAVVRSSLEPAGRRTNCPI